MGRWWWMGVSHSVESMLGKQARLRGGWGGEGWLSLTVDSTLRQTHSSPQWPTPTGGLAG